MVAIGAMRRSGLCGQNINGGELFFYCMISEESLELSTAISFVGRSLLALLGTFFPRSTFLLGTGFY